MKQRHPFSLAARLGSRGLCVVLIAAIMTVGAGAATSPAKQAESQRHYEDALEELSAENSSVAIVHLRNALQKDPNNLPARILLGNMLLYEGQAKQAIKEFEKALSLGGDENLILVPLARAHMALVEPEKVVTGFVIGGHSPEVDGTLHLIKGDAYAVLRDLKSAEESYLNAMVLLPAEPHPLLGQAKIALVRGRKERAREFLKQAIAVAPNSYHAWLFKAKIHRDFKEYQDAINAFERVMELESGSGEAYAARAAMWLEMGREEEARKDLERAESFNGTDIETIYLRTLMLFREGKSDEARELLRESADTIREIKEDYRAKLPNTTLLLGIEAYFEGTYGVAVEHFKRYLALVPGHPGARRYLGSAYLALGEWDNVIRVFRSSEPRELPVDPMSLSFIAEAYRAKGDHEMAAHYYEEALRLAPESAGLGVRLAQERMSTGRPARAVAELESLTQRFPDLVEANLQLALAYVKVGRMADAEQTARGIIENRPDDPQGFNVLGAILMAANKPEDAKSNIRTAVMLDPELILPRLNLARLAELQGDLASAETEYRTVLERHPYNTQAGVELAELLSGQKEYDEARERIDNVLKTDRDLLSANILKLRLTLAQEEDPERIDVELFEFLKKFPEEPEAILAAGSAYISIGDIETAKLQFRRAVKESQFDSDVLFKIAKRQVDIRDYNGALWAIHKVLLATPRNIPAGVLKVRILTKLGEYDRAEELLGELMQQNEESAELFLAEGDLRVAQKQPAEAVIAHGRAFALRPNAGTAQALFQSRLLAGELDEALAGMKSWIDDNPDDVGSQYAYADVLVREKRLEEAREVYEALRTDSAENVLLFNNLANIYQRLGDGRALATAKLAYELAPENASVIDTYGWILTEQGRVEEGLPLLREAFARQSTDPGIRYHIGLALVELGRTKEAITEFQAVLARGAYFEQEDAVRALLTELGNPDAE